MLSTDLPMLFGLGPNDELFHVSKVKSGKKCNCCCPGCGASLLAKKGRKMRHHFAHFFVAECPGGAETALHLFAKQTIVKAKRIRLPNIRLPGAEKETFLGEFLANEVAMEEKAADTNLRPDLIFTSSTGQRLAIEVRVKHAVDDYKVRRLIRSGLETIEIDVRSMFKDLAERHERDPTLEELKIEIVFGKQHKKWLFNLRQHRFEYRQRKQATARTISVISRPTYTSHLVRNCPDPVRQRITITDHYRYTYARLHTDCHNCPHRVEVEYAYEWRGFQRIPVLPKRLLCSFPKTG